MEKRVHLVGNAHLDPVWLWRYFEGLAEVKATFQSALDRIEEFDGFIFTSACAFYYKWVEENCPEMFEKIQEAVRKGRWQIVGGQWIQPDCNIPSLESIARHYLYSQRYFQRAFGKIANTGYNVDSFGHAVSLPKLLRLGGMKNYVYMRPADGPEKSYPFRGNVFRWQCRGEEVLAYRIPGAYNVNFKDTETLKKVDDDVDAIETDYMFFYGVGNHGGGPTITNLKKIQEYREVSRNEFVLSSPDHYFRDLAERSYDRLPVYEGDLQTHAPGCFSANSEVKKQNRDAENRLCEAEKYSVLANWLLDWQTPYSLEDAWKGVLFNQFHDIICGCSIKLAYQDANRLYGQSIAMAQRAAVHALEKISWSVDTSKGIKVISKEDLGNVWEMDNLGTPIVIVNPLSHPVKVPVRLRRHVAPKSVTDETDTPIPFQLIHADYNTGSPSICINAEIPAFGYRTYWVYGEKEFPLSTPKVLKISTHSIENDRVAVCFDEVTGNIRSFKDKESGIEYLCKQGSGVSVFDGTGVDTWGHHTFCFDKKIGCFDRPKFRILEKGDCIVRLEVTQYYQNSFVRQIYTLQPSDPVLHVKCETFMNDWRCMVKLEWAPSYGIDAVTYEAPGDIVTKEPNGREEPMQRFFATSNGAYGLAVCNNGRYSACATPHAMSMVAARTCYYADHDGADNDRLDVLDLGSHVFEYSLVPFKGSVGENTAMLIREAEILNTEFLPIQETYHQGPLPQSGSLMEVPDGITVTSMKPSEDGNGIVFRICETAGREVSTTLRLGKGSYPVTLSAWEVATYLLSDTWEKTDFLEWGEFAK